MQTHRGSPQLGTGAAGFVSLCGSRQMENKDSNVFRRFYGRLSKQPHDLRPKEMVTGLGLGQAAGPQQVVSLRNSLLVVCFHVQGLLGILQRNSWGWR